MARWRCWLLAGGFWREHPTNQTRTGARALLFRAHIHTRRGNLIMFIYVGNALALLLWRAAAAAAATHAQVAVPHTIVD